LDSNGIIGLKSDSLQRDHFKNKVILFTGLEPTQVCWDVLLKKVRPAEVMELHFSNDPAGSLWFVLSDDTSVCGKSGMGDLLDLIG